jgi:DNA-binding CsgD family transcriptional regulator
MAERLTISRATVRSHVAGILRKLRVPDRDSALRLLDGGADVKASRWDV